MSGDIATFTASFGIFAAFIVGGFALLFNEMRRLEIKLDTGLTEMREEFRAQRAEMNKEFRAQREEVTAQITAILAARKD